jgi:4-alpha-glucanotransferase
MTGRASGLLLHITSLPSRFGIGDLGPAAYRFVDFLAESHQKYWQILPLNPTSSAHGSSPYKSTSANAANILLISPDLLVSSGLLDESDLSDTPRFPEKSVDFPSVERYKNALLTLAFENFQGGRGDHRGYVSFCDDNRGWLEDFSLFTAIHRKFGGAPWSAWPEDIRRRKPESIAALQQEMVNEIGQEQFLQYIFHIQWLALHEYCTKQGIQIIGDMPIYVDYDSADVWTWPQLFRLDADLTPLVVAGVPPDYFSRTGQLWRNPLYNWEVHRHTGFAWWLSRLERALSYTDLVRIDHFRGLVAYWEVPAGAVNAIGGRWVPAPGEELMGVVRARFPHLPVIAEDLGTITLDVRELMHRFNLAGMRVLLFTFTGDLSQNPNAPHNIPEHVLLYTGTHDNAPVRGWYEQESSEADRQRVVQYLGPLISAATLPDALIRLAMISAAETTIIPMQDLLGLGSDARMNTPGSESGNWQWRLQDGQITPEVVERLRTMTRVYNRA